MLISPADGTCSSEVAYETFGDGMKDVIAVKLKYNLIWRSRSFLVSQPVFLQIFLPSVKHHPPVITTCGSRGRCCCCPAKVTKCCFRFKFPFLNIKNLNKLILIYSSPTYHSDGEVVVYNAVRHRVPSLLLVRGRHIDLPAIQHHLGTVLDVAQYLKEALALVASERNNIGAFTKGACATWLMLLR